MGYSIFDRTFLTVHACNAFRVLLCCVLVVGFVQMHRVLLPSVAVACQTGAIPIHVKCFLVFVNDNRGGHWVLLLVVSVVV